MSLKYVIRTMLNDIERCLEKDKRFAKKQGTETSWTRYKEIGFTDDEDDVFGILVFFDDVNKYEEAMRRASDVSFYAFFPMFPRNAGVLCTPYYDKDLVAKNEYAICFFVFNGEITVDEADSVLNYKIPTVLDFIERRGKL